MKRDKLIEIVMILCAALGSFIGSLIGNAICLKVFGVFRRLDENDAGGNWDGAIRMVWEELNTRVKVLEAQHQPKEAPSDTSKEDFLARPFQGDEPSETAGDK